MFQTDRTVLVLALVAASLGAAPALGAGTRWIAAGGGRDPASTQVSLEQDVGLAREVFGQGGLVLFAGGREAFGVQVLASDDAFDPLRRELADLFDPRDGRDAKYRLPRIAVDGPATRERLIAALGAAGRRPGEPLLVYLAAHGEQGKTPRANSVQLWGEEELTVADVAAVLDDMTGGRTVRLVISTCFSGGFADLVFARADPEAGPAPTPRCGLFASRWEEEASGCDPNPDRRAQEGYGLHFLHALRGEDRDGRPLPLRSIDYDGDGRISLLEAHTRARIASRSFGSPTTTAERWLRHAAPETGPSDPVGLPEERAVIEALGADLGLATRAAAEAELTRLDAELSAAAERAKEEAREEEERFRALRIALLERWPTLDDPWRPELETTLRRSGKEIRAVLDRSPQSRAFRAARDRVDALYVALDESETRASLVRRLVRAHETESLAARLHAAGGRAWQVYRRLVECERGLP